MAQTWIGEVAWNVRAPGCRITRVLHNLSKRYLSHKFVGGERESDLVLSDTNFSSRDICSTCSSHLSLSRSYVPDPHSLPSFLDQAPTEMGEIRREG